MLSLRTPVRAILYFIENCATRIWVEVIRTETLSESLAMLSSCYWFHRAVTGAKFTSETCRYRFLIPQASELSDALSESSLQTNVYLFGNDVYLFESIIQASVEGMVYSCSTLPVLLLRTEGRTRRFPTLATL